MYAMLLLLLLKMCVGCENDGVQIFWIWWKNRDFGDEKKKGKILIKKNFVQTKEEKTNLISKASRQTNNCPVCNKMLMIL